jgi:hypothetical protein
VQGSTLWDNLKKVAMASFAMKATERDPDFVDNFYAVSVFKNTRFHRLAKSVCYMLVCASHPHVGKF